MNPLDSLPINETLTVESQAAVAEAVRCAAAEGEAVYPIGGGTMLDIGGRPTRPGKALSLAKLNRIVDYPADDLTITVEAGTTYRELQQVLFQKRQWLPCDVPYAEHATVGGLLALGFSGPRRIGYGPIRDYLLGVTAVAGRGEKYSCGGRVVKNAAGYNLGRFLVGSLGTLSIITQATFMVRPLPETAALLACELPDLDMAERLLAAMVSSPVRPVAVELSAGQLPSGNPLFGPLTEGCLGRLYVGLEGFREEVEWMLEHLRREWSRLGMTASMLMPELKTEKLWRHLADFPAHLRICVLPSKLTAVLKELLRIVPDGAVQAGGDGLICTQLPPHIVDEQAIHSGAYADALSAIRTAVAKQNGKMVVLRQPSGAALSTGDLWGPPDAETLLRQAVKERFDPHNILNPDRLGYF